MREIAILRQLRTQYFDRCSALRVRRQTETGYPVRNKPLDEVKNQKKKKYVVGKSEMDLKISNYGQPNGNVAVVNAKVRELTAREEDKTKKVEGGYRSLLQIPDALANTHELFLNGRSVPNTHNCRGDEE